MTSWRRAGQRVFAAAGVATAIACGSGPASEGGVKETSASATPMSLEQARDSARAFIARSSVASQVYLDSSEVAQVDSIWRVTFRRRALVVPNVVTVDVHATTGAMRFPGDE